MKRIYLDYAATTPMRSEVVEAMLPYFTGVFGNPSTIYSYGQEAKEVIEVSRSKIARLIKAQEEEIVFTGSGTEADNLALTGIIYASEGKKDHVITSSVEHHAVSETTKFLKKRGYKISYLPVDKYGLVNPDDVKKALTIKTALISVMHANNEVGTIEPIKEIGRIAREAKVYFHTDAVQTVGHIGVDVKELGVDLLSISAHKLYGPKGVGALYIRKGTRISPLMHGGEQEKRRRAGTENVPGIVGFGVAAELALEEIDEEAGRLRQLRDRLVEGLEERIKHIYFNGHPVKRLPNNVNICVEYVEGESMVLNLDLEGICVSSGSACTSSSLEPSHVLSSMGLPPELAHGSLRFTLGKWTTNEDIDRVLEVLPRIVAKLRAMSPLLKSRR
ncbi:MAG: cysteine desulfurase NifS [Dehalococcoidales bacterium]|jgi:cysteine desulfurase|nr:cysteine desulfurase NifS [Dehalococcoidales bacterium]MDP6737917.1 cysteine desulfurase NifS [Dehalococcoidales bacterium]|tara:strand:+ start:219 stop:1385 length:1167 start_codon:yes stop_codon:yes gene_type:complete